MNGLSESPVYALCGTPMISNVIGNGNLRTVYWRGGYGCVDYKIERNDQSDCQNDENWKIEVSGVNDFNGYWQDNDIIDSNRNCTYYRVTGENYDKVYSDTSDVYTFCF